MPEQDRDVAADYTRNEQELLAYLREAERAASDRDIASMLRMQARVHSILVDLMGNQTQRAFQVHYLVRNP